MIVKSFACALHGIDAFTVSVEVDLSAGTKTYMAGLPDNAVKESRQRIEPALKNSGFYYPGKRIIINLAPADVKKEGTSYDLAIAIGVLAASKQIEVSVLDKYIIVGELSLDGSILPINGALSIAVEAKNNGFTGLILPSANVREASVVDGLDVYAFNELTEVVAFLQDQSLFLLLFTMNH